MKAEMKITAMRAALFAALFAVAWLMAGCSVTKVNYEKDETGKVSYRLYRNDHWLKTSGTGLSGGMTKDGKFEFAAEGLERSPSEEFNRTMQTYTSAFVQLAQIAAAAYNPSASKVVSGGVESGGVVSVGTNSPTQNSKLTTQSTAATQGQLGSDKVSVGSDSVADANTTLTDANAECADCKDPAADCKDCVVK